MSGKTGGWLKSRPEKLAAAVILISFVCALWVNGGNRMPAEAADRTVGLLVDYDELKRVADGSPEIVFADMARKAVKAGATGLVVRERILADWENAGDALVFSGAQLSFYLQSQKAGGAELRLPALPAPDCTYILTEKDAVYEQLFSLLEAKRRYPQPFAYPGYKGIAVSLSSAERATLGLGFPLAHLEEAAREGLRVIPRIRGWEPVRADSMRAVFDWAAKIPNLAGIGFNDLSVPGGGTNPELQDQMAEILRPLEIPLISFEFYDQAGLAGLAARLGNRVLRAHAIAENELRRYSVTRDAVERFTLAATERNIRYIYVRFSGLENPAASMDANMVLIGAVRDGLSAEGLRVGDPEGLPAFSLSAPVLYLTGLGVVAAGIWLLAFGAAPFAGKKLRRPYLLALAAGCAACAAWAGLLGLFPILARKLFALAAAVVFPSLGILLTLKQDMRSQPAGRHAYAGLWTGRDTRALLRACGRFLLMSAWTLMGAVIMSALLAEPAFMLKLDAFVGVKAAHLIPLVLVPLFLWLREKDCRALLAGTAESSVKVWQLAAGMLLLAGLAVYILRTGNESLGTVSGLEMRVRQLLDRLLAVRPRTKEFLIGHPMMLLLLFFGYRFRMFPILVAGIIGQVSLMNTYAHLHTPVTVSLLRSFHGLWLGLFLGMAAAAACKVAAALAGRRTADRETEKGELS